MIDLDELERKGRAGQWGGLREELLEAISLARSAEALRGEVEELRNVANDRQNRILAAVSLQHKAESSLAAVKGALEELKSAAWDCQVHAYIAGDENVCLVGKEAIHKLHTALSTLTRQEKP